MKQLVVTLRGQNDFKGTLAERIGAASLQLTLSNALVRLLSLVSMPILTHLLAPKAYGTAAMAGTIMSLISVIGLAGMDMSYIRAYHDTSLLPARSVEVYAWRYVLSAGLLSCIGIGVAWPVIAPAFSLPDELGGVVGIGILLCLAATMAQARARLNNRYQTMSISIVAAGIAGTAVSLGAAQWWRRDEWPLVLSMLVGYLVPLVILGAPSVLRLISPSGLNQSDRRHVFGIGLAGTVTAPIYWIMSSSDRWFLGFFENAASVGVYSMGYSVAIMGMMANNAVLSVWTPETAKAFESDPKQAQVILGMTAERLIIGFACVWLAITAAGGDAIRLLAAPPFHEAARIVPAIAAAVMFHGIIHIANAIFLLRKRLKLTLWFWFIGALFSMALNTTLIPLLGMLGAAISQAVSFFFVAIGMLIGAQRLYPLRVNWCRLGYVLTGILVAASAMFPSGAKPPT